MYLEDISTAMSFLHLSIISVWIIAGSATVKAPPDQTSKGPASTAEETPKTCTYSTYEWSLEKRGPVNQRTVEKPYNEVTDA